MKVLDGVRVLDLGSFVAGPYAATLLADLGADVIKVESPGGGDSFRAGPTADSSVAFKAHNRNKRSIALDYRTARGLDILLDLVRQSDVLVINSRPGQAERRGIGHEALMAVNPRLIYCEVSGFGPAGPYAQRPAFDTMGQSLSGWASLFQEPSDPRIRGPVTCDTVTAMFGAYAVLGALFDRARTGKGRYIELNMVHAMTAFSPDPIAQHAATGQSPSPFSRAAKSHAWTLTCGDGLLLSVHLSSPQKFWDAFAAALGDPRLMSDPRFATRALRVDHYEALGRLLNEIVARRPRAEWEARLTAADVPFSPAHDYSQLADDPQITAMDLFYDLVHPKQEPVRAVHRPVSYDGQREVEGRPAPLVGEHTSEILRSLGITPAEEEKLKAANLI